jgi:hypothetical protein
LLKLSKYVELQSANRTVAESSGFTLAKDPSPFRLLRSLVAFSFPTVLMPVKYWQSSTMQGARAYMYQISLDPADESKWETTHGTIRQNLFTDLESGKRYYVRVAAIGIDKQVVYSDVVSRTAQ